MLVPRILSSEVVGCAEAVEQPGGDDTCSDDAEHDAPVGRAGDEQQACTEQDSPYAGLTHRAGYQTVSQIPEAQVNRAAGSELRERGSAGEAVNKSVTAVPTPGGACADERLVARHVRRVSEEQERTGDECYVEDVITRTAEHLFGEDDCKSRSHSHHPQRSVDRHDERNQETRNQEALGNLLVLPLSHGELYSKAHDITNQDIRQHGEQTEPESLPEQRSGESAEELSGSQQVLVADVVHAEKHTRNECEHYVDHRALGVIARVNLRAEALAGGVRREEEALKAVEQGPQRVQLAAFLKVRTELLFQFV